MYIYIYIFVWYSMCIGEYKYYNKFRKSNDREILTYTIINNLPCL